MQPCNLAASYPRMTQELIDNMVNRAAALKTSIFDVLKRAGVNESTWWRWKSGKSSPTLKTINRIGSVLDEIEAAGRA